MIEENITKARVEGLSSTLIFSTRVLFSFISDKVFTFQKCVWH